MGSSVYKVLITTSGTGSRLGALTAHINKALVRIGQKPAIASIIEAYPKEVPMVITVGYLAEQLREFLPLAYPDRTFEFVQVDTYEGDGSSLGFSMLHAENNLQSPFIFHSCDTIVTEPIPAPMQNWIGGFMVDKKNTDLPLAQYRTHSVVNNSVVKFNEKGEPNFESIHIGLIGINDFKSFWKKLKNIYESDKANTGHSDVHVVGAMLASGSKFDLVPFHSWYDTGNPTSLAKTRQALGKNFEILDKEGELTFIFDTFVIKYFSNAQLTASRVKRAAILSGLVPELQGATEHFYRYQYVPGELYARVASDDNFRVFLDWAKKELWLPSESVEKKKFHTACHSFYHDKTLERVKKFLSVTNIKDGPSIINGVAVPSLEEVLNGVNFKQLSKGIQSRIHGDFILDNVIKTPSGYCLLDWRQDFSGLLEVGDLYYDLGKLNHNLTVNHDKVNNNAFSAAVDGENITCSISRSPELVECEKVLETFVKEQKWDWRRVNIVTSLIWLNMSPLHPTPQNFNLFLFYFGKLHLWQTLQKQ